MSGDDGQMSLHVPGVTDISSVTWRDRDANLAALDAQ
jgi:hypothetical protein